MSFTARSLLVAAFLAATASAQTTEIQMFNAAAISIPSVSMEASIIDVNAVATTLAVNCVDEDECAYDGTVTVTQGPSTFAMEYIYPTSAGGVDGKATQIQDCQITSSTQGADCTISLAVELSTGGSSTSTVTTTETAVPSDDIVYTPVKVTAGAEKLSSPEATETPDSAAHMGYGGAAAVAAVAAAMIV